MIRLLIAAPSSGCGKTAVTCALLQALRGRGFEPCAFKCGPDYIDPMFHRAVLGVESHNLDLFLSGTERVKALFSHACNGHGAAVVEGAMGFYDGLGGISTRASAWELADTLDLPVLLVLPARGAGLTLAAQLRGLLDFRPDSHIAGVLLNECPPGLCRTLAPALESETGLPVFGCLPRLDSARIESRHLGLMTAGEIEDLDKRLGLLTRAFEDNVDLSRLLTVFCGPEPDAREERALCKKRCRIAVARDEAFCFCYAETLETLEEHGAEIAFFSPLHDVALPEGIGGLYLPGGYPELYARQLSENTAMLRAAEKAVRGGLPTVAECGGFLWLGAAIRDLTGERHPMVGMLPGEAADTGRSVRFGYATLRAEEDSLLFRAGESYPVHEFHHWDTADNGESFTLEKPLSGRTWRGGFAGAALYAAFPHLYFAGDPVPAERFVCAAEKYEGRNGIM